MSTIQTLEKSYATGRRQPVNFSLSYIIHALLHLEERYLPTSDFSMFFLLADSVVCAEHRQNFAQSHNVSQLRLLSFLSCTDRKFVAN
jgi:hypothetical protein